LSLLVELYDDKYNTEIELWYSKMSNFVKLFYFVQCVSELRNGCDSQLQLHQLHSYTVTRGVTRVTPVTRVTR
jgi:hypothetical protein